MLAQATDHGGVVGLLEDRRAGDEDVDAAARSLGDVVGLDAAIDLDVDVVAVAIDFHSERGGFLEHLGDEGLAAEARVHRHEEHLVDVGEHVTHVIDGRGRVEHHAGALARVLDLLHHAMKVHAGFRVDTDDVGAGFREVVDVAIGLHDHEVHVERELGGAA